MRKSLLGLLAVSVMACSNTPTRGSVCDRIGRPSCEMAIRCETWAGTQADCEQVARYACCEDDGTCGAEVVVDADRLDTCIATIRGATCGTSPLASEVCRSAVSEVPAPSSDASNPPADGGSDVEIDGGAPSRLYQSCSGGLACGGGEDCYVLTHTTTAFTCTRLCTGPDDTSCPDGHCVRLRTGPRGTEPVDGTPVCLQACISDADCGGAWTCTDTATGYRVCVP